MAIPEVVNHYQEVADKTQNNRMKLLAEHSDDLEGLSLSQLSALASEEVDLGTVREILRHTRPEHIAGRLDHLGIK